MFTDVDPQTKTRAEILYAIRKLFQDIDRKRFVIYYSGHGKHNGDWVLNDGNGGGIYESISLNDILFLWHHRKTNPNFKQDLVLISDSCHSGHWVDILKRLKPDDIWMQAASRANEYSYDGIDGGIFTTKYVSSACRFISSDEYFNILYYIGGLMLSSIGSVIAIFKDKIIGYAYHKISKPFKPCYYVPRYYRDEMYYFDRIYMGITNDTRYHLHCYFFNRWDDLDFIQTVNYYAKYGSLGKMGTINLFDTSCFVYYTVLLTIVMIIIRIGFNRRVFDAQIFDIYAVYTVGIVTRLYFL